MGGAERPRRSRPCIECKKGRKACFEGSDSLTCARCARLTRRCLPSPLELSDLRETNNKAEIRNQIKRLESVLAALESGCCTSESSSPRPPAASDAAGSVEINDLIGAMTQLCFRPDGVGGPRTHYEKEDLVREAADAIKDVDQLAVSHLTTNGYSFQPSRSQVTLQDLLDELPPLKEGLWLIEEVYGRRLPLFYDCLFWPTEPLRIQRQYRSGFQPAPHPSELAEIFGILATACGSLVACPTTPLETMERPKWQIHMDRYTDALQRALSLSDYVEDPTHAAARALVFLIDLHLLWSTTTARITRGLAIISVALSIAERLGYREPGEALRPCETPEQTFCRRILVTTLLRLDWTYNTAYGRRALSDPRAWCVDLPERPRSRDLPLDHRDAMWWPSHPTMHSLRSRYRIARLLQNMRIEVFADPRTVDYGMVRSYGDKVQKLREDVIWPQWRFYDNPVTGIREPCNLEDWGAMDLDEMVALVGVVAKMEMLTTMLHRPFLGIESEALHPSINYDWHRAEMVSAARNMLTLMRMSTQTFGPFLSIYGAGFDALVGICTIIFACPDSPGVDKYRHEFSMALAAMAQLPSPPVAVIKVARLGSFLLDRPRVRQADAEATMNCKRLRKGRKTGDHASVMVELPALEDHHCAFTFGTYSDLSNSFDTLNGSDPLRRKKSSSIEPITPNTPSLDVVAQVKSPAISVAATSWSDLDAVFMVRRPP